MWVINMPPLDHITYTHEADDGSLRAWDVTRGLAYVSDGRRPMLFSLVDRGITVDTVRGLYKEIDEDYAMTTDFNQPLLFIPFFGECLSIDGWHRLFKAAKLGIADVLMYLLTQEEADSIKWLDLSPGHGLSWLV